MHLMEEIAFLTAGCHRQYVGWAVPVFTPAKYPNFMREKND
jgi:hypothetical protein